MQRRLRMATDWLLEFCQDLCIDLFYEIVTTLVQSIDGAFHCSNLGIADFRISSFVFLVPEIKICAMLGADQLDYLGRIRLLLLVRSVPCFCRFVVHLSDESRIEHRINFGEFYQNSIRLQTSGSCGESLVPAD